MPKAFYSQESLFDRMQPASWHGRYFKTKCPFHDDREPSFLVFENGGQCLSLSCNRRASLKQIYQQLTGSGHLDRDRVGRVQIIDWAGMPELEIMIDEAHEILNTNSGLQHYLAKRGVLECRERQLLGWWLGWYTVPIFDERRNITGVMLRASPSMQEATGLRWMAPPGQGSLLYSPDWSLVHRSKRLYVVFGIFDALALSRLGFPVVSPTFLKGFRAEMLDDVRKPIFIVPDAGELTYARDLVSRLGWRGNIIELPYPSGLKDPAGFVQIGEVNALRILLS